MAVLKINNKRIIKKVLLIFLRSISYIYIKNLSKKTYDELIESLYEYLKRIRVRELKNFLKKYDVKNISRASKQILINIFNKSREEYEKDKLNIKRYGLKNNIIKKLNALKSVKTIDLLTTIIQSPINSNIDADTVRRIDEIRNGYDVIENKKNVDKDILYVDENMTKIIKYNEDVIKKTVDRNQVAFITKKMLVYYLINDNVINTKYFSFDIVNNKISLIKNSGDNINSAGFKYVLAGFLYNIILKQNNNVDKDNMLKVLKAHSPSSDRKYNNLITVSTEINAKYCIYSSFLHIINQRSLYYRHNKEEFEDLRTLLNNEGDDISKNVKDGNLVASLLLLTKKYFCDVLIINFDKTKDDFEITKEGQINYDFKLENYKENNQILFYDYVGRHVSPTNYKNILTYKNDNTTKEEKNKSDDNYKLRPKVIKGNKSKFSIYGYDCETYLDDNKMCNIYCITLFGKNINDEIIQKKFYGNNCLNDFSTYLDSLSDKTTYYKNRPKNKVNKIYIYGFNNASFDNLLLYKRLYELNTRTKYVFTSNAIPYIKYNNIQILDISRFYRNGSLRSTCKDFKLEKEKGVFPYKFTNANNLFYNGDIPDVKYWNSEDDYNEYKSKNNNFDMMEYTIKYCLLDSELVYELGLIHQSLCNGVINGRKYDVSDCSTGAKLAMKIFQQTFLNDDLQQSPKTIISKERSAYKGGRTEKFKNIFNGYDTEKRLHYYDINSSYPYAMTYDMPFKFIKTVNTNKKINNDNVNELCDYYLYKCAFKYVGDNKYFIPNLLIRNEKTKEIIPVMESEEYSYMWGIELKEAIKNNCEIQISEINLYEGKPIFKEYSQYFYSERLKAKKDGNVALSIFYKLLLNSLYGKFGQNTFNKSQICRACEIDDILKKNKGKLIDIDNIEDDVLIITYKTEDDENKSVGQLVRFASYITSIARSRLSEFMRLCGHENVYYCDTDSVFTSTKIEDKNIIDNIKLGCWKEETSKPIIKACFVAPKAYSYKTEDNKISTKAKGIDGSKLNDNDMYNLINDKSKIEQTKTMFFRSFKGVKIDEQTRTLTIVNNKRIFDLNDSTPFKNLNEWSNAKDKWIKNRKK